MQLSQPYRNFPEGPNQAFSSHSAGVASREEEIKGREQLLGKPTIKKTQSVYETGFRGNSFSAPNFKLWREKKVFTTFLWLVAAFS
jgi:hypothetical protein